MKRTLILMVLIGLALALVGCPKTVTYPDNTLEEYIGAVRAKNAPRVYSLLGDSLRQNMTEEDFEKWFVDNYVEISEQADELEAVLKKGEQKVNVTATIPLSEDDSASFAYLDSRWYFTEAIPVSATAGEKELRDVALAFEGALGDRNLDSLLKVLSSERSETIEAELDILVKALANSHEREFSIQEDTAYLMLDGGIRITFIMENGVWKVHDIVQEW